MAESLSIAYRPESWAEVLGQKAVVSALSDMIKRKAHHTYLLTGPSGVGKTTCARIAANELGCAEAAIMEVDAATHTSVEAMRDIQQVIRFRPFGASDVRVVIIDECQRLSRQAWESLLKITEEPPAHVYWFFCTTEPDKVPATIKTRSAAFSLKSVAEVDLEKLLAQVIKQERIKIGDGIAQLVVREANGSPRQLLMNLEKCRNVIDRKQAAELLHTALDSDAVVALCRFLLAGGGSWAKAMGFVEKLADESPEGVRIVIMNYVGKALRGAKSDRDACFLLRVLGNFAYSYNQSEGLAPLLQSIGATLFTGGDD